MSVLVTRTFVIPVGARGHRGERLEWCHRHGVWGMLELRLTVPVLGPGPVTVEAHAYCRSERDLEDLKFNRGAYTQPAHFGDDQIWDRTCPDLRLTGEHHTVGRLLGAVLLGMGATR